MMWYCNEHTCVARHPTDPTRTVGYKLVCPHPNENKAWLKQQSDVFTDTLHICPKDNILTDIKIRTYNGK